jgi:Glycosyl hydrolases family 2
MSNRIVKFEVRPRAQPPSEADVEVVVVPERLTPGTELLGRVMGPHCASSSTVEVAYPFRPTPAAAAGVLAARAVIPEASLWDAQRPFVYRAVVELWQDGQRCDKGQRDCGFRTVHLGPRGLRWNGWPLTLQGTTRLPGTVEEAQAAHRAGYNLVLDTIENHPRWETAQAYGFLVLARVPLTAESVRQAERVGTMPCCLGWLLSPEGLGPVDAELIGRLRTSGVPIGVELIRPPTGPLPEGVSFVAAPETLLPALEGINLPWIACGAGQTAAGEPPGLLGRIQTESP